MFAVLWRSNEPSVNMGADQMCWNRTWHCCGKVGGDRTNASFWPHSPAVAALQQRTWGREQKPGSAASRGGVAQHKGRDSNEAFQPREHKLTQADDCSYSPAEALIY